MNKLQEKEILLQELQKELNHKNKIIEDHIFRLNKLEKI
jgi:chromosome segregation ATPase